MSFRSTLASSVASGEDRTFVFKPRDSKCFAACSPATRSIAPTNLVYLRRSSSMRACLPRTGLFTTAAPVRSAIARVVPIATVLLMIVRVA